MQHTSPDHDARLLPWIDATGSRLRVAQVVERAGSYSEDKGASPFPRTEEQIGYDRLMACLMHSDDVRCEVCGDDQ